jgi:hypothetical protein
MSRRLKAKFQGLRCPHCGESVIPEPGDLSVNLEDRRLTCWECSEPITRAHVVAQTETWMRLFAWVESAPSESESEPDLKGEGSLIPAERLRWQPRPSLQAIATEIVDALERELSLVLGTETATRDHLRQYLDSLDQRGGGA